MEDNKIIEILAKLGKANEPEADFAEWQRRYPEAVGNIATGGGDIATVKESSSRKFPLRAVAAAAVITLVMYWTVSFFCSPVRRADAFLGKTAEAMSDQRWIYSQNIVNEGEGSFEEKCWSSEYEGIKAKRGQSESCFVDYYKSEQYVYERASNTITISEPEGAYGNSVVVTPYDRFEMIVTAKGWKNGGVVFLRTDEEVTIKSSIGADEFEFSFDSEKKVVERMEIRTVVPVSGSVVVERIDMSYPAAGPVDIYSLGVPRNAKIIDVRQAKNVTIPLSERAVVKHFAFPVTGALKQANNF